MGVIMMNNEEEELSIRITLKEMYDILKDTQSRVQSLESNIENKMQKDGIPDDINKLFEDLKQTSSRINDIEKKLDEHIERIAAREEGKESTNELWIKILSGVVALLSILQVFNTFLWH